MTEGIPANLLGAAAALLLGAAAALFNHRLAMKNLKEKPEKIALIFGVRQAINIAVLAAVYFLTPLTPANRTWTLIGAAVGLTLPALLLTLRFSRNTGSDDPEPDKDPKDSAD